MNEKMRWIGAVLALMLVLLALPLGVQAQGGPGQGNPPPGQVKENGQEGGQGDAGSAAVNQLGQLAAQGDNPSGHPRLVNVRAERLIGLPIINLEGEEIGEVGDVLVNIAGHRQSGNPAQPARGGLINNARADFVLAQFGGVLGWDRESVPVPFAALRLHLVDGQRLGFDDDLLYFEGTEPGDDELAARTEFFKQNALVLVGEQDLDNAPQFDLDSLGEVADPAWDRNLRAYWQGLGAALPEPAVSNGAAYRVSSVRVLGRYGLRELGGDALGGIDDVLLTLALANPLQAPVPAILPDEDATDSDLLDTNDAGNAEHRNAAARALAASLPIVDARVHYALVGHGGWWGWGAATSPVPLGALMMDRDYDERTMYLEADDDLLDDAPAIDSKQGDELNDENFFTRVRAYWEQAGFGPFER